MEDNNYSSENSDSGSRIRRGHWRPEEDEKLIQLVREYGAENWGTIAESIEGRTGKSCRLRWFNQLDPSINKGPFSREEGDKLIEAHNTYGNKWSTIASLFPNRTDNTLKNHFHVVTARKRKEETKSPGPIRGSSYFQRPSESRFQNLLMNNSQFRGLGTPYPFQFPAASSTSWSDLLLKATNSSSVFQAPSYSSSFEFSLMMTKSIGPEEHGNYVFQPRHASSGINSKMARGSSSLVPAPHNYHSTKFLGLGIEQATPSVESNHSMFMVGGSGNDKIGEGPCSVHKNATPFIDFMGVEDK
ncbi:unnamed protein product [Rhodiola kirilowii]